MRDFISDELDKASLEATDGFLDLEDAVVGGDDLSLPESVATMGGILFSGVGVTERLILMAVSVHLGEGSVVLGNQFGEADFSVSELGVSGHVFGGASMTLADLSLFVKHLSH
jgi:hypothetical protein